MKYINRIFFASLTGLLFSLCSCADGFDKLNTYPLAPPNSSTDIVDDGDVDDKSIYAEINLSKTTTEEELKSLEDGFTGLNALFKSFTYEGVYGEYQRAINLTHDIYAGYFTLNRPDWKGKSASYVYTDDWSKTKWEQFYNKRIAQEYSKLIRSFWYVDREKNKNAYYITRIYFAFLTSLHTDTYGDIPFSEYVRGTIPQTPTYNTQEKVYDLMFRILEQAADSIQIGNADSYNLGYYDCCYGGDENKWVRFANTLRLRLALRISNIDPLRARKEGEAALNHFGGLIQDNSGNMSTTPRFSPLTDNDTGNENIYALCSFRYKEMCMSKDMENAYKMLSTPNGINDYIDPRCPISWFKPSPYANLEKTPPVESGRFNSAYKGCQNGDYASVSLTSQPYSLLKSFVNGGEDKKLNDKYWFGFSRESVWLGFAESRFLLAEASLRGWSGASSTPETYFEEGIRESLIYYNIPSAQIDIYIEGLRLNGEFDAFLSGDHEFVLEKIITHKWLAIFPNGSEGWAEFRRTDYPRLLDNLDNSSVDVPKGKFIKRISYPNSEFEYNPNTPSQASVNQGTRVWWDVSDTNADSGQRQNPNNFR